MTETKQIAWELVPRFARCANYPKDDAALECLVDGLVSASEKTGISMQAIVERCCSESQWCPADYDLLTVAREIRGPLPQRPGTVKCPHRLCDGSGWREAFFLWTFEGQGEYAYTRKEAISREDYDRLSRSVDHKRQQVHSGRYRCKCHPARPEPEGKR